MSFEINKLAPRFCVLGDMGEESERNDLLAALLQQGYTSLINLQSASLKNEEIPYYLRPWIKTWAIYDNVSDINLTKMIFDIYPLIYQDIIDTDKYEVLGINKISRKHVFRKYINSFREKNELFDISIAIYLKSQALVYVNMGDNLKLFSPETQLRFRRYGMNFLVGPQKTQILTSKKVMYSITSYQFRKDIHLYPLFSEWVNLNLEGTLNIILIEREKK